MIWPVEFQLRGETVYQSGETWCQQHVVQAKGCKCCPSIPQSHLLLLAQWRHPYVEAALVKAAFSGKY